MKFIRIGPSDSEKYDELIETMPAFVKIHSPNCGHCVNMKEAWDALEDSDDIKNYDIAIIEVHEGATNNINSPSGKIDQGLPTIRAVKLHGKNWNESPITAVPLVVAPVTIPKTLPPENEI